MSSSSPAAAAPAGQRSPFRARVTDHLAVAVGTKAGLFIVRDGITEQPILEGPVPAFLQLGTRYLAGTEEQRRGSLIRLTDDGGASWREPAGAAMTLPDNSGATISEIAQLASDRGAPGAGEAVLAGVAPAALFSSMDSGDTFELVRSLWDHPDRPHWGSGCKGQSLHTILTHPDRPGRIIVAISGGGLYRSEDAGATWSDCNNGIGATALARGVPEDSYCIHKIALEESSPDTLWAQGHHGTYRSDDGGDGWVQVDRAGEADGLPSNFGFPVVAHPVDPGSAFVFPLDGEGFPYNEELHSRVWQTADGGRSWTALRSPIGHLKVLPDALTISSSVPFPLVFGADTGQLFASADHGGTWRSVVSQALPPVLCVRVLE